MPFFFLSVVCIIYIRSFISGLHIEIIVLEIYSRMRLVGDVGTHQEFNENVH